MLFSNPDYPVFLIAVFFLYALSRVGDARGFWSRAALLVLLGDIVFVLVAKDLDAVWDPVGGLLLRKVASYGSEPVTWAHLWRWPIVPSVVALRSLHEAGVPIGVVSNAAGQIESVLRRFGVCQVGEGDGVPVVIIIDSTIVGVAKPDPAIFSFALDVLDAKPEHVAYVGDSYANDVVGARAAGMRPFLLDPYDDHAGADYERITAVADLVPIVRAGDDRSR